MMESKYLLESMIEQYEDVELDGVAVEYFKRNASQIRQDLYRLDKLGKAISILKAYFKFIYNDKNLGLQIISKISCDGKGTTNCIQAVENYRLLKEVLGNE